jgi:hypothetical protein
MITLNQKYFVYPLSLQQMCLSCAKREIPNIIENLNKDLIKIIEEKEKKFNKLDDKF